MYVTLEFGIWKHVFHERSQLVEHTSHCVTPEHICIVTAAHE